MEDSLEYVKEFDDIIALRRRDLPIRYYFDTVDIVAYIRGIYDFFDKQSETFNQKQFDRLTTLIHALFGHKLIGDIYFTPAHQYELSRTLADDFKVDYDNPVFRNNLSRFLKRILKQPTNGESEAKRLEFYRTSQDVFKVMTMLDPRHWQSRLYWLVEKQGVVQLSAKQDNEEPNLDVAAPIFSRLQKERPDKSENNRRDALAMEYLSRRVAKANHWIAKENNDDSFKKQGYVPIFFDSQGMFTKIINEDHNLRELFMIRLGSREIFALKPSEFFLCTSLYKAEAATADDTTQSFYRITLPRHQQKIDELESHITNLNKLWKTSDKEQYHHQRQKLAEALTQYIKVDFFRNIISPLFSDEELRNLMTNLRKFGFQNYTFFNLKVVDQWYESDFKKYAQQVKDAYSDIDNKFFFLAYLLEDLPTLHQALERFIGKHTVPPNLYHTVSLTRFGFPGMVQKYLESEFLNAQNYNRITQQEFALQLYQKYVIWRDVKNNAVLYTDENRRKELYELLVIIWLIGAYRFARELYIPGVPYSNDILMLFGANFVRDDESRDSDDVNTNLTRRQRTDDIISNLRDNERNYLSDGGCEVVANHLATSAQLPIDQVQLWINARVAVAFLDYHILNLLEGGIFTKSPAAEPTIIDMSRAQECLLMALQAYQLVKQYISSDINRLLYVTNIYIYYTVEIGSNDDFNAKTVDTAVTELTGYATTYTHYWHFRYDDTLARYYHRLSSRLIPNDQLEPTIARAMKETKFTFATHALEHINRALSRAEYNKLFRDVREINQYKSEIDRYFARVLTLYNQQV
ncbi:hypothetical protein [Spirosoma areae]